MGGEAWGEKVWIWRVLGWEGVWVGVCVCVCVVWVVCVVLLVVYVCDVNVSGLSGDRKRTKIRPRSDFGR